MRIGLVACLLLIALVGAEIVRPRGSTGGAPPLDAVPMQLGRWTGERDAASGELGALLGVSQLLFRRYRDGGHSLTVYVGYFAGDRASLRGHSPDRCYVAQGYQLVERTTDWVAATPVNRLLVSRGAERRAAFYWWQHGHHVSPSNFGFQVRMLRDALIRGGSSGSVVLVDGEVAGGVPDLVAAQRRLIAELLPHLRTVLAANR